MINITPGEAPFPIEDFLKFSAQEQALRSWNCSCKFMVLPCSVPVRIGLFFDGTNNNLDRDRDGVRMSLDGRKIISGGKRLSKQECSHSNVAKLFEAFKESDFEKRIFSYYFPGVGTRFVEIGELTETSEGKAFAKGGQARIIFAILQTINAIHLAILGHQLYSDKQAGVIAQTYDQTPHASERSIDISTSSNHHVAFFEKHLEVIKQVVLSNPKPRVPSITLDIFGFSRGAAEAVAFCHMFDELLVDNKIASIPASINFLGLFDTVASVGVSASVSMTTILPRMWADGHYAWAARLLKPLPASVRSGRHYIAGHEQRMNFPVTTQKGSANFKEVYFPGVHSDVGGGYSPGDSGKGRERQSALLSQIPLAYMYKEAYIEGVLFKPYEEFEDTVKEDFSVSAELASAWDAYCKELEVHKQGGDNNLQKQMRIYYYWRAARLDNLEQTPSFRSASLQSQQDLASSNHVLKSDLAMLRQRGTYRMPDDPVPMVTMEESKKISQWHVIRVGEAPGSWEKWALSCFENPAKLSSGTMSFFDNHVHDSIAGFYLAGEVTEFDKRVKIASVMRMRPDQMNRFDKKIFELKKQTDEAVAKKKRGEEISAAEEALAKEAESGTPYPIMTDEDTLDMRSAAISTQTSSRREGGGYLIKRQFYPQDQEGIATASLKDTSKNLG